MHSNNDDNPTPSPNTAPSKGVPKPTPDLDDAWTEGVRTESSNPTINAPPASASVSAPEPAQPPPRQSECVTQPSWKKEAANKQAAKEAEAQAECKAQCKARKQHTADTAAEPTEPSATSTIAQMAYIAAHGKDTPQNYCQAISGPDADEWWKAMHEEYNLLQKRGTWELVD